MSSTNRGAERLADDLYETPPWATRALLPLLGDVAPGRILEPCAGKGKIVRVLREHWPEADISAVELDGDRAGVLEQAGATKALQRDFLQMPVAGRWDLVVTNPPFAHAQQFIERCLGVSREVCMLLRLNYLGSDKRAAFWRATPPDVFVLPRRPSFAAALKCKNKACGWKRTLPIDAIRPHVCPACCGPYTVSTTDSCEYAWMCWGPGRGGRWGVLEIEKAEDRRVAAE